MTDYDLVVVGAGPAGMAAAIASVSYQSRNIRSTKFITVQEAVETISGIASASTSRPPQGRAHQPVAGSELDGCCIML